MKSFIKKYLVVTIVLILSLMFILEITSALSESQTMDEAVHLAAGYSYLRTGDFRMNPEHPPLLKYLSALPLLFLDLHHPTYYKSWAQADKWQFASDFLYHNKVPADIILILSRIPIMLLGLLAAYYVFKWTRELFGLYGGLFAVLLFAFSPNILAHSRYVTTDLPVTLGILICIYYFGKYLEKPNVKNLVIVAIIFGVAQVTKFSAIIILPILIILYLIKWWQTKKLNNPFSFKNFLKTFIFILLIAYIIIFITYGFEIKKPLDDPDIVKLYEKRSEKVESGEWQNSGFLPNAILANTDRNKKSGQIIYWIAENIPVPSLSYLKGIVQLASHNYFGHQAYLNGHYSNFGWWYYFPLAYLVKSTIAEIILLVILIIFFIKDVFSNIKLNGFYNYFKLRPFYYYLLIIPPLIYFLWSLTSHLNLGVRHILPIYPFIIILSGYLIMINIKRFNKLFKILLIILLLFHITSSILIYPHFLAYFNEAVGGSENGPKYLIDSNIDWGQDLKNLEVYLKKNKIQSLCLSYFGTASTSYYLKMNTGKISEIPEFESSRPDCLVAVSVSNLFNKEGNYRWLTKYEQIANIGYSIYIFSIKSQQNQ